MIKKQLSLLIALMLVCTAVMLGACGSEEISESAEATYTVTVKNAVGTPYSSGVIVKFLENGEQVAMQPCDANGTASKALASGEYTVELAFTDDANGYYYENNITLTAENSSADVILSKKITAEPTVLYVSAGEYDAYSVGIGSTYAELSAENRNYFLFTPTEAGNYKIYIANNSNAKIGYYGGPHFVQEASAAEVTDNAFTISVSSTMIGSGDTGTTTLVIGIDADANTQNCILCIERIGDALKTVEDEPWTIYEKTVELSAYQLPEGKEIKEFDLTAETDAYNLVYNETDGFYHLDSADGPLVLVRLAEDCEYIACFKTILDRSGVSCYFFDDEGNLHHKESYSECLLEYIEYVDEAEGVYPLTKDLEYIIKMRGQYVGWWDPESSSYLFVDMDGNDIPDINNEIAWLLMCCYIE